MNFWWVNHKQMFCHEFFGRFVPKNKTQPAGNPFYETMREVAQGDNVFSFVDGAVQGFSSEPTVTRHRDELEKAGLAWDEVGWRVDMAFVDFTWCGHSPEWLISESLRNLQAQSQKPILW